MKSPEAEDVLRAVRRRLRRLQLFAAARSAAWLTVVIALGGVLLHLLVRPVGFGGVVLLVAVAWAALLAQALATRVTRADCAAWADRQLGGQSAYVTFLEATATDAAGPAAAALAGLTDWIRGVAPTSLARLQSLRLRSRLRRPAAVAIVSVALSLVLLQIPLQRGAVSRVADTDGSSSTTEGATSSLDRGLADTPLAGPAVVADRRDADRRGDERSRGASTPPPGDGLPEARSEERAGDAAGAAGRAASGGRDAGASADTSGDAGLSDPWQGAMAATLRSLGDTDREATRADPGLSAEFEQPAGRDGGPAPAVVSAAAATAPDARRTVGLGPAEEAYVRAYFADPGATP